MPFGSMLSEYDVPSSSESATPPARDYETDRGPLGPADDAFSLVPISESAGDVFAF
jgi:hypothetical protein